MTTALIGITALVLLIQYRIATRWRMGFGRDE
jgi:hypothetical protein